jgi:4-diphosphocytidyl-2-C-methyl-D-erythritol kinase
MRSKSRGVMHEFQIPDSQFQILTVRAFAKINLSLRVLGVRADGYHELRTVFQSIALHDTLHVRAARGPFAITCDDPACPVDSSNLVARAAHAVWKAAGRRGVPRGVAVRLQKRIPLAAGLGGGSSDAAAALRAFARLWKVDPSRLPALAASLGADVPFFLAGGTVLGIERGDVLFQLIDHPARWVTLVIPRFGVRTQDAYAWLDHDRRSRAGSPRALPSTPGIEWPGPCHGNDLQGAVARRHPEIARIAGALRRSGACEAAMTGSGSAVFGLFSGRADAARAAEVLVSDRRRTIVTRTLGRLRYAKLAGN